MALSPPTFALEGPHAALQVQALGAMVGPVTLRLPDDRLFGPMYRAPWHGAGDPELAGHPLLRHLNGEWLCAPYGPATAPPGLPAGWNVRALADGDVDPGWDHGWIANHAWRLVGLDAARLHLMIEPPALHVLARVERVIGLLPDAPGFEVLTTLHPRRDATWPLALHPTFALPPGGVELRAGACRAVHAYPIAPVPGVSRLRPGGRGPTLAGMPAADGSTLDLRRLPLDGHTEELLQLQDACPPFTLRYGPEGDEPGGGAAPIDLDIDWDASLLPDLLVWISQRGRGHAPWNGRNLALGIEPCSSCFDLTRVADPPADHPLAHRRGVALRAGEPLALRWSLRARVAPPGPG